MLNGIILWSLQNRVLVIGAAIVVALLGVWSMLRLHIDAFPETSPVLVQVNAAAPALGPVEVEQQVTVPLERSLGGIPGLQEVRSVSKAGLTQVIAQFEDGTDIYRARQMVQERTGSVALPSGVVGPELGPITSGMGEIVHYILRSDSLSLAELTSLHDWVIRPQLLSVRGVAEVNTWGGLRKQYQVQPDPLRLSQYGLTLGDVVEALEKSNVSVGGGYVVKAGELQIVRGSSLLSSTGAIA